MTGPILILVGPPGAGKTTVGAQAAAELGHPFTDTDQVLAERGGVPAGELLIERGEAAFRELEAQVVTEALGGGGVVALGSGAVEAAQERLLSCAQSGSSIVFLDVSLPASAPRLGLNVPRAVALGNARAQLAAMAQQRRPHYTAVATRTIDTSTMTVSDIVAEVLAGL